MPIITPTGNDSNALQKAINQAGESFGTVQLEPIEYILNKSVRINKPIRVLGAGWKPRWEEGTANGTWFRLGSRSQYNKHYERYCPFHISAPGTVVKDIAFRQVHPMDTSSGNWDNFTPEPDVAAIYVECADVKLENLFLYNVTHGIYAINAGRLYCDRIIGFPLRVGIEMDHIVDVGRVRDVHFWNFWPSPRSGFTSENPDPRVSNVNSYVLTHGIGLLSYRNDNPHVSNFFTLFYDKGIAIQNSPHGWGTTQRFHLTSVEFDHCRTGIEIQANDVSGQATNVTGMGNDQYSFSGLYVVGEGINLQLTNVDFAEYGQCGINVTSGNTFIAVHNLNLRSWNRQATIQPPPLPACPGVRAERSRIILTGGITFGNGNGAQRLAAGGDGGHIECSSPFC